MNEEKDTSGKYLLIGIILVAIVIIVAIILIIATSDDDIFPENNEEVVEQKEKEKDKQKSINSFIKAISTIKYIEEKDLYKNDILVIENKNITDYYNVNTGKKIYSSNTNNYKWYGTFGIFDNSDDFSVIDEEGNVLFTASDTISYYPETKLWEYSDSVYDSNGLVEENASIIDNKGYYLIAEKKDQVVLENNKLKAIYSLKLDGDEYFEDGELNSIYSDKYALISTSKYDIIIDANNGKEVHKGKRGTIKSIDDNLFEIEKNTYYVKNDKLAIKADGTDYKTEISSKYIAIGNKVYDTNTLSEVDSNTFIPEKEDALIESLTGLELTECRNGYGLKYKGEEILECKYETVDYFDYNVTRSLISSNKLYVIISIDNYSYEVYDVYNKKIALYNVDDYDYNSPFITLYQDDNIFIYNIIDGSKTPNNNGDDVSLYDNYYALISGKNRTYYNKDFKEIYQSTIED